MFLLCRILKFLSGCFPNFYSYKKPHFIFLSTYLITILRFKYFVDWMLAVVSTTNTPLQSNLSSKIGKEFHFLIVGRKQELKKTHVVMLYIPTNDNEHLNWRFEHDIKKKDATCIHFRIIASQRYVNLSFDILKYGKMLLCYVKALIFKRTIMY